ncbi:LmbU family transcriptional regulator [Nocardiopsis alba]|jgi:hypothetical protein|nr:LmbU family transcriptional regulator [Nocardiopsis alba]
MVKVAMPVKSHTESIGRNSRRNGRIAMRGVTTRRTTLLLPTGMPIDDWEAIGHHIFVISDSSGWWLGDWLVYGQENYPNRYKCAIAATSLDYQTLRNYAWVARKFVPERRREKLSMQHHAEVAGLSLEEQEHWLSQAEAEGWSRNELRRRTQAGAKRTPAQISSVQVNVRGSRKEHWQKAAESSGMELVDWIGTTLDTAAQHALTSVVEKAEAQ